MCLHVLQEVLIPLVDFNSEKSNLVPHHCFQYTLCNLGVLLDTLFTGNLLTGLMDSLTGNTGSASSGSANKKTARPPITKEELD